MAKGIIYACQPSYRSCHPGSKRQFSTPQPHHGAEGRLRLPLGQPQGGGGGGTGTETRGRKDCRTGPTKKGSAGFGWT
jgi:hypothetical protein